MTNFEALSLTDLSSITGGMQATPGSPLDDLRTDQPTPDPFRGGFPGGTLGGFPRTPTCIPDPPIARGPRIPDRIGPGPTLERMGRLQY